jgi:SAM-dependent methyltransferase
MGPTSSTHATTGAPRFLCPECRQSELAVGSLSCLRCAWEGEELDGIPVLLSARDRDSALFSRYLTNYDEIAGDDLKQGIQEEGLQRFFNQRLLEYLGPVAGQRVCDVGLGKGIVFDALRTAGVRWLVGVDIAKPYLERFVGLDRAHVVLANAENLPFRDTFDVVIATDILEHVINVGDFLLSIRQSLVAGGRLLLRVPYKDDMLQYARLNGCEYEMVHLRNFAEDNLTDLLRRTGFIVEELRYDGFYASRARPWLGRTRLGRRLLHEFGERIVGGSQQLEQFDGRFGRWLMDPLVITAVARRG